MVPSSYPYKSILVLFIFDMILVLFTLDMKLIRVWEDGKETRGGQASDISYECLHKVAKRIIDHRLIQG